METVVTALIVITVLLLAVLTLFQGTIAGYDTLHVAWREMETRLGERARTDLTPISTETKSSGSVVEITLRNDGDTRLADFENWDFIAQYYRSSGGYFVTWVPYVGVEPANNEWTIAGIYLDTATATAEIYEPGILNPGEEVLIRARLSPPVGPQSTNLAAISTSNGVSVTTFFTR